MVKIGAVWAKSKDGKDYLSGRIELDADVVLKDGLSILGFRPRTERDNGPAWEVFVSRPKPQGETSNAKSGKGDDGDIPF